MRTRVMALGACALSILACGGPQTTGDDRAPPRPLDEARALEVAAEVLGEYQGTAVGRHPVRLTAVEFDLDVMVDGKPVGLEYLTEADRQSLGRVLGARPQGQLRVIAVEDGGGDRRMDVLFLEDRDYRYDPNPERAGGGPTIQEVEGRFRRDLRDFLEHERTAGNL